MDIIIEASIDKLRIGDRVRKDLGDLDGLAADLSARGLLQPIGITKDLDLVWGLRRVLSARSLGWTALRARVVPVEEIFTGQLAENLLHKAYTISERVAVVEALKGYGHGGARAQGGSGHLGLTVEEAAARVGMSRETFFRSARVLEKGVQELVAAMDRGTIGVSPAARLSEEEPEVQRRVLSGVDPDRLSLAGLRRAIAGVECDRRGVEKIKKARESFASEPAEDPTEDPKKLMIRLRDTLALIEKHRHRFAFNTEGIAGPFRESVKTLRRLDLDPAISTPVYENYATPPHVVVALLENETFSGAVSEPCCGNGAMVGVLRAAGLSVDASDVRVAEDIVGRKGVDVFELTAVENVVTNPPFRRAREVIEHLLAIATGKVAILWRAESIRFFETNPPARLLVFRDRPRYRKHGTEEMTPVMRDQAWLIWEPGFKGQTRVVVLPGKTETKGARGRSSDPSLTPS